VTTSRGEGLRVDRDGRVVTLTLDRPGDQNRLSRDVLAALHDVVDRLRDDDETQAVVITGAGREFSSKGRPPRFTGR
jgi:enoyl-CoA hydratase/carnithine racemase